MHNVPPTIECDRVKLLTQFVRTQAHKSLLRSRSLSLSVCVSPVGALIAYGAHIIQLSFGKLQREGASRRAKKRPKVAALANN